MAESIKIVAQVAEHLFYQDYRPASALLKLKHFIWLCIAADTKLKQDEYDKQVINNFRKRTPNAPIMMASDNYISVEADIKDSKAILKTSALILSGASPTLSFTQVELEGNCGNAMPIMQQQRWQVCNSKNIVYYIPSCYGIEFIHLKNNCDSKKVAITYIPELNEKSGVQESRKWAILNMVTVFIKAAKDGTIIDMSNDGNANTATQTEINKYLLEALKK